MVLDQLAEDFDTQVSQQDVTNFSPRSRSRTASIRTSSSAPDAAGPARLRRHRGRPPKAMVRGHAPGRVLRRVRQEGGSVRLPASRRERAGQGDAQVQAASAAAAVATTDMIGHRGLQRDRMPVTTRPARSRAKKTAAKKTASKTTKASAAKKPAARKSTKSTAKKTTTKSASAKKTTTRDARKSSKAASTSKAFPPSSPQSRPSCDRAAECWDEVLIVKGVCRFFRQTLFCPLDPAFSSLSRSFCSARFLTRRFPERRSLLSLLLSCRFLPIVFLSAVGVA